MPPDAPLGDAEVELDEAGVEAAARQIEYGILPHPGVWEEGDSEDVARAAITAYLATSHSAQRDGRIAEIDARWRSHAEKGGGPESGSVPIKAPDLLLLLNALAPGAQRDDRLAESEAFAREGWAWVDEFCEALSCDVFTFKDRVERLKSAAAAQRDDDEVKRLREGLIRLVHGDYDAGWTAESYADALLDGAELADEEWTIEDQRRV